MHIMTCFKKGITQRRSTFFSEELLLEGIEHPSLAHDRSSGAKRGLQRISLYGN